jgi:hypothetical protein
VYTLYLRDKALVQAERALSVWIEDKSLKLVQVDVYTLCEKVLSLCEYF